MPLQGCRALVAEDQTLVLLDIADILTAAGAKIVGPATSVRKAMQYAQFEPFDCAVLDVMLRDGYIFPVADLARQKGKGIVFVTGVPHTPELKARWPEAEILSKPAAAADLIRAVSNACKAVRLEDRPQEAVPGENS